LRVKLRGSQQLTRGCLLRNTDNFQFACEAVGVENMVLTLDNKEFSLELIYQTRVRKPWKTGIIGPDKAVQWISCNNCRTKRQKVDEIGNRVNKHRI